MTLSQAYILGILVGLIAMPLMMAGIWMKVKFLMLKYDQWLINKQLKNYVNKLHDNRPEKRRVLFQRRNRK